MDIGGDIVKNQTASGAVQTTYLATVGLLLDAMANPEAHTKELQMPLMRVAAVGCEDIVELLVGNGADLETTDKYGQTALFFAVGGDHEV